MSDTQASKEKLSSARLTESTDKFVEAFTASIPFDRRMYRQDIQGSLAHARMLNRVGILTDEELADIERGLRQIQDEIERGEFEFSIAQEDIHMNIEARLTELIGITGKKLHTGRSRNDQVATDIRLYLRDEIDERILPELRRLMAGLIEQAERYHDAIMPGFTHLQTAQPVTFGHHMLAWFEMLYRDAERLLDARKRINTSPLGSAALAGTTYPIDRHYTAELLSFERVGENSLDGVS
ncbi:argininosuccinate lyase, partial [Sulfurivirga sp.]|uniref:argininosuccinate lyase n=1 Tax=Sulfurivirga sp. TaxID=2614236 RepID=UPI0025D41C21